MKRPWINLIIAFSIAAYFFTIGYIATKPQTIFYCADNTLPTGYDFSCVELMENFVLDVVDETDFWDECDSTAFNEYAENSPEWYFYVCMEYQRWDTQKVN